MLDEEFKGRDNKVLGINWEQGSKTCGGLSTKDGCNNDVEVPKMDLDLKCDWSSFRLKRDDDKIKIAKGEAVGTIGAKIGGWAKRASARIKGDEKPEEKETAFCSVKTVNPHQSVRII
jgi:hypothetical protein